jgi:hypothetical protein
VSTLSVLESLETCPPTTIFMIFVKLREEEGQVGSACPQSLGMSEARLLSGTWRECHEFLGFGGISRLATSQSI